jgi:hypothetical protein
VKRAQFRYVGSEQAGIRRAIRARRYNSIFAFWRRYRDAPVDDWPAVVPDLITQEEG